MINPEDGSYRRSNKDIRVVLPDPVGPIMAVMVPGLAVKLTPSSTGIPDSYSKLIFSKLISFSGFIKGFASGSSSISGSISKISNTLLKPIAMSCAVNQRRINSLTLFEVV